MDPATLIPCETHQSVISGTCIYNLSAGLSQTRSIVYLRILIFNPRRSKQPLVPQNHRDLRVRAPPYEGTSVWEGHFRGLRMIERSTLMNITNQHGSSIPCQPAFIELFQSLKHTSHTKRWSRVQQNSETRPLPSVRTSERERSAWCILSEGMQHNPTFNA